MAYVCPVIGRTFNYMAQQSGSDSVKDCTFRDDFYSLRVAHLSPVSVSFLPC